MKLPDIDGAPLTTAAWRRDVLDRVRDGSRFAGLYGSADGDSCDLIALVTSGAQVAGLRTRLQAEAGVLHYPALSPELPAAFWYERALHDLSDVLPDGHPRLDPLLLHLPEDVERPRPGLADRSRPVPTQEHAGPVDVAGHGMFTLPFGPVRSGVFESIEFLLETPGEDIPHLTIRPQYKHRGIAKQFEGRSIDDAVFVAERVEGIASVAHALAFSHAVEALSATTVPHPAGLLRVVHAELERIANHLDVAMRLSDAAGLAVATARFALHKEAIMRLVSRLCGNRFGRGVVVPGGVNTATAIDPATIAAELARVHARIRADADAVMSSASFLDRLRTTGLLAAGLARAHGALGPIGRASGYDDDDRRTRPYDAYRELAPVAAPSYGTGDALARLRVRWHEIDGSARLVREALEQLRDPPPGPANVPVHPADGFATGWAEAPQGEVLYGLEVTDGRVRRCFARSASFHNLVLFHDVFGGDVFTDFPFIEASFGLSYAGVAM